MCVCVYQSLYFNFFPHTHLSQHQLETEKIAKGRKGGRTGQLA